MRSAVAKALTLLFLAAGGTALASGPASADVVSPPGACSASGDFTHAKLTVHSTAYVPSDVIVVPRVDVVQWSGHEHGRPAGYVGEKRPIAGAVRLVLPGSFDVSLWSWADAESTRYANAGAESYRLPSILIGVKLKITGYEADAGRTVCSGSVFVEVAGSDFANPLGWVALGGSALFLVGLVVAGFRKVRPPSAGDGT
jgi:hypothetical protein